MTLNATNSNANFWISEWNQRNINFHKENPHPMLVKHFDKFIGERKNCNIFFPLCGKAVDMAWLASMGHKVVGIEIVKAAIEEFFDENKINYTIKEIDNFKVYESENKLIKLYLGDFYEFNNSYEGLFNAIWDRGALVAIPPTDRKRYIEIMLNLMSTDCTYFLDTFDYHPSEYPGPPHYISEDGISELFGNTFQTTQIDYVEAQMSEKQKKTMTKFCERVTLIRLKRE